MKRVIKYFLIILTIISTLLFFACANEDEKSDVTSDGVLSIGLNKYSLEMHVGEAYQLESQVSLDGKTITWSSSETSVVTVNQGLVIALKTGNAIVSAICEDQTVACVVKVTEGNKLAPTLTLNRTSTELYKGYTLKLEPTLTLNSVKVTSATYTWESENAEIATVNNGLINAINVGKTKIRVSCEINNVILNEYCSVTVKKNCAVDLSIDKTEEKVLLSESTLTINAVKYPQNAEDDIEYVSSDDTVAIVNNGIVTFKKSGDVIITVKCGDIVKECSIGIFDRKISTKEEFLAIKDDVNLKYYLVNDIDLGYSLETADINDDSTYFKIINSFSGTIDGNGKRVSNIVCLSQSNNGIMANCSMFGTLTDSAIIRNLDLHNVYLGKDNVLSSSAGLCVSNGGMVENVNVNVFFTGKVASDSVCGGIIVNNSGKVLDCMTIVNAENTDRIGSVVGNGNNIEILKCLSIANEKINSVFSNNANSVLNDYTAENYIGSNNCKNKIEKYYGVEIDLVNTLPVQEEISDTDVDIIAMIYREAGVSQTIIDKATSGKWGKTLKAYETIKDYKLIKAFSEENNTDGIFITEGKSNTLSEISEYASVGYINDVKRGSNNGSTYFSADKSAEININVSIKDFADYESIKIYFMTDKALHLHLERAWTQEVKPYIWNEIVVTLSDDTYTATMTVLNVEGNYQKETITGNACDGYITLISMTGGFAAGGVGTKVYFANVIGKQSLMDAGELVQSLSNNEDVSKVAVLAGVNSQSIQDFTTYYEVGHSDAGKKQQGGSTYVTIKEFCEANIRITLPNLDEYKTATIYFKNDKGMHIHIQRGWTECLQKNVWHKAVVTNNGNGTYTMVLNALNVTGEYQQEEFVGNLSDGYVEFIVMVADWSDSRNGSIYFANIYGEGFPKEIGTVIVPFSESGNADKIDVVAGGNGMNDGDIEITYSTVAMNMQKGSTCVTVVKGCEAHLLVAVNDLDKFDRIVVSYMADKAIHLHVERAWTQEIMPNTWNEITVINIGGGQYQATMTVQTVERNMQTETVTGQISDGYIKIILMTKDFASNGVGTNIYFANEVGIND